MNLLAVLSSVLLAFKPGAWLAFTLAGSATPFSTRLGLALALSPFVVGVQMLALTALGVGFGVAAGVVIVLNAPAMRLIWRGRPRPLLAASSLAPAVGFAVLAAGIAVLWLIAPGLRIYSWHNMMQAEAVYQVIRLPRLPEEMGLAGVRLNYAWFGTFRSPRLDAWRTPRHSACFRCSTSRRYWRSSCSCWTPYAGS